MPEGVGYPNESEQERKQRIKKLKAKTSKMRLAVSTFKKSPPNPESMITLGDKKYTMAEFKDHMASTDRPTYSGEIPGAADKLRKQRAKTKKSE